MSLPVQFRPEAQAEYDSAIDWYEQQRAGLGADFMRKVGDVVARISTNPLLHAKVHQDVRKAVVRRFP
jgi:plasmid stabilization system protein ParE